MRNDHGPFRGFKGENDPQITVTNAVEALPLARHGFDAGHFQRVTAHGFQLRPQLDLQLSVQAVRSNAPSDGAGRFGTSERGERNKGLGVALGKIATRGSQICLGFGIQIPAQGFGDLLKGFPGQDYFDGRSLCVDHYLSGEDSTAHIAKVGGLSEGFNADLLHPGASPRADSSAFG